MPAPVLNTSPISPDLSIVPNWASPAKPMSPASGRMTLAARARDGATTASPTTITARTTNRIPFIPFSFSSRSWMEGAVHLPQVSPVEMRVDRGGRDRRVSQQLLDHAQVGAPREQMGRERMAERVRMDARREPRRARVPAQDLPEPHAAQPAAARVHEQQVVAGFGGEHRTPALEVLAQRALGRATERDHALPPALARDRDASPVEVEPAPLDAAGLG